MRHLPRAALTRQHHRDPALRPRQVLPCLDDWTTKKRGKNVPRVSGKDPELRPNLPLVSGDSCAERIVASANARVVVPCGCRWVCVICARSYEVL